MKNARPGTRMLKSRWSLLNLPKETDPDWPAYQAHLQRQRAMKAAKVRRFRALLELEKRKTTADKKRGERKSTKFHDRWPEIITAMQSYRAERADHGRPCSLSTFKKSAEFDAFAEFVNDEAERRKLGDSRKAEKWTHDKLERAWTEASHG